MTRVEPSIVAAGGVRVEVGALVCACRFTPSRRSNDRRRAAGSGASIGNDFARLNLAAAFGEGVRLGSVTIEITDDPVTRGIEKRLGWLGDGQTLNRVWKSLSDAQHGILSTANWRSGE